MYNILATTIACVLDASFGYPDPVYKKIKHPVVWLGAVIAWLERNFNSENPEKARNMGILSMLYLLFVTFIISYAIAHYGGFIGQVIGIASLLAGHSLYQHVNAVYHKLKNGDTEASSEAEICTSSIKTLATGFGDRMVAPLFWALLLNLPGIACYKAINTASTMINPEIPRYRYFGQAAATLNTAANFIPERLSFLIIYLVARLPLNNLGKTAKEAENDISAYPQVAMAKALGVNLNGKGSVSEARNATIFDLERALNLFLRCCFISFIALLVAAVLLPR